MKLNAVEVAPAAETVKAESVTKPEAKEVLEKGSVHPHFHAMIRDPQRQDYPDVSREALTKLYGENLHYVYWGHIFGDTHTHGNHPFDAGTYIRTSLIKKEEVIEGVRYIHTLNSVYKVIE